MSDEERASLLVLVVLEDDAAVETCKRALEEEADRVLVAHDVAEAIALATRDAPDVALIDVTLEAGAGLALAHHLRALFPTMAVHASAPVAQLELAAQALALGATGLLVAPIAGDDVMRVVNAAREKKIAAARTAELERDLERVRKRGDLLDRVLRLARGSGHSEAVRAIVQAIAEAGGAHGAALYATFEDRVECVRLGAVGSARTLPKVAGADALIRAAAERGSTAMPLEGSRGPIGLAVLEGADPLRDREVATMVDLAAAVLTLVDVREPRNSEGEKLSEPQGRIYSAAYFRDTASREVDRARRHARRLSIAVILPEGDIDRVAAEGAINAVVRDTDVVARLEGGTEYGLLLPETPQWGAAACRRRVLDRVASREAGRLAFGIATFPHDGMDLDRLLYTASARAKEQARSVVRALGLGKKSLDGIVDALLARPMLDVGTGSTYPIDVTETALVALAMSACREARRGGAASVLVTSRPGVSLAGAVRESLRDAADVSVRAIDVRAVPGCEDLDAVVLTAEHGAWVCCGRNKRDRFRGVHTADPLLCDLMAERLLQAAPSSHGAPAVILGSVGPSR